MSEDGNVTIDDLRMVEEFLEEQRIDRGDLLKWGAGLGLAAAGAGALAGKARAAASAPAAEAALQKRFGWMIAVNAPFFELQMTRWMRAAVKGTGYKIVTQSEDSSAVKAQQIMTNMIQQNFAFIAKADGVPPKPFEPLAKQAKQKGIFFINHAVQAVGGSGQNVAFDHAAAGRGIGTAAVNWAKKNKINAPGDRHARQPRGPGGPEAHGLRDQDDPGRRSRTRRSQDRFSRSTRSGRVPREPPTSCRRIPTST